ncbi:hypothetical protein TNCV_1399601 [Trichonephila clavipes]|nr:hypothetical protein TNCV_1399601 [Trichonephila clavipes]
MNGLLFPAERALFLPAVAHSAPSQLIASTPVQQFRKIWEKRPTGDLFDRAQKKFSTKEKGSRWNNERAKEFVPMAIEIPITIESTREKKKKKSHNPSSIVAGFFSYPCGGAAQEEGMQKNGLEKGDLPTHVKDCRAEPELGCP